MQIKDFPLAESVNSDDLILIQQNGTDAFLSAKSSQIKGSSGASTGGRDYVSMVLSDFPEYYFRFDEADGSAIADSSGIERTIAANGLIFGETSLLASGVGSAARFDGVNSYAQFVPSFSVGDGGCTFECLVRVEGAIHKGTFVKIGDGNSGFSFGLGNGNLDSPGNQLIGLAEVRTFINTGKGLSVGNHHVAMSVSANGDYFLYLNGRKVMATSPGYNTPSNMIGIGAAGPNGRMYNGVLDEVAIYPYVLNEQQIYKHWKTFTLG